MKMKPARRPHGLDRDGMMLAPAAFLRYLECSVSAVIQPCESFVLCMFRARALAAAPEHGHGRRAPAPRRPHYCPSPMPQPYYANAFSIASPQVRVSALPPRSRRSEEHTSELQSLMRISYAVFCLKKKTK